MPYRICLPLALSALLACAACGDSEDTTPQTADAGTDVADPDADSPDAGATDTGSSAEAFVGTWVTAGGSGTMVCSGVEVGLNSGLDGTIEQTANGPLLRDQEGCEWALDVEDDVASIEPGSSCEQTNDQGTTQRTEIDRFTLTLSEDGQTAAEEFEGQMITSGQSTTTCEFDFSGTLERGN